MKRALLLAVPLAIVSTVIWSARQPALNDLRADLLQARSQKNELDAIRQKLSANPEPGVDREELDRLRGLRPELARLRGSIAMLRQRTNQSPSQLEAKAYKLTEEAAIIRARREAKALSKSVCERIGRCVMLVTESAINTDGTVPQNWNELRQKIASVVSNGQGRLNYLRHLLDEASGPKGFLEGFEIVQTLPGVRLKRNQESQEVPLIREIQKRPQPDGGFARYYAWSDGRAEEITIADGDFSSWESKNFNPVEVSASAR